MRKTIGLIILIILITGCGNQNQTLNKDNKGVSTFEDILNGYIKKKVICEAFEKDIAIISSSRGVTNAGILLSDGTMYQLNLEKKYSSTNSNCRIIDTTGHKVATAIFGDTILDDKGEAYSYIDGKWSYSASLAKKLIDKIGEYDNMYWLAPGTCLSLGDTIYIEFNNKRIVIENEKILNVKSLLAPGYKELQMDDGNVIGNLYVVTDKNYYICLPKQTNSCEYADQKCDYEYVCEVDKKMNQYRDDMRYYDGTYLIDNSGNLYIREY